MVGYRKIGERSLSLLFALLLCSCDEVDFKGLFVPTGDRVDQRFNQSLVMTEGRAVEHLTTDREEYLFYACTDVHISDTYHNLRQFCTLLRNDDEALFGWMLGDCVDRRGAMSLYAEAIAYQPESQQFSYPIFSVIGNHDLFFSGWDDFRDMVSPSVYWFEVESRHATDLYLVLDSASGTLGGEQTAWLRQFLEARRADYRHCIIATHTNLFYSDNSQSGSGNLPLEESFSLLQLLKDHKVQLVLQGHDHYREDLEFLGVRYVVIGTLREEADHPEYLRVEVIPDGVNLIWCTLS